MHRIAYGIDIDKILSILTPNYTVVVRNLIKKHQCGPCVEWMASVQVT